MKDMFMLKHRIGGWFVFAALTLSAVGAPPQQRHTEVSIQGQAFHINGRPTYQGRSYQGMKIEGLLMNARLVQAIFDDLNPETRGRWAYPDGPWDPERNTREFIAAMPGWREHGLQAFTLNLQGGSPEGYSREQPWHNSAFTRDGSLRPDYLARLLECVRAKTLIPAHWDDFTGHPVEEPGERVDMNRFFEEMKKVDSKQNIKVLKVLETMELQTP